MRTLLAAILAGGLLFWTEAHAYLDPGTGSAILQGILGALAALAITIKLYWHRLLRWFGIRRGSPGREADSGQDGPRHASEDEAARPRDQ